jgi:hypothetical protein
MYDGGYLLGSKILNVLHCCLGCFAESASCYLGEHTTEYVA